MGFAFAPMRFCEQKVWTDLCAIAFDPNYSLFQATDGAGNCLFPSPLSSSAHGSDHIVLFEFLGRILGKALYEGITSTSLLPHPSLCLFLVPRRSNLVLHCFFTRMAVWSKLPMGTSFGILVWWPSSMQWIASRSSPLRVVYGT